jgi:hypothetical protein
MCLLGRCRRGRTVSAIALDDSQNDRREEGERKDAIVAVMMPVISIASLLSGAVGAALDPLHYLPDRHQEDEGWKGLCQ